MDDEEDRRFTWDEGDLIIEDEAEESKPNA